MEYKEILNECEVRAEVYRTQDAVWNLTHEEKCAAAIKDLLARAESAEADNERLRQAMKPNCLLCESVHKDNGNCTEVGGFCTAVPAAHCPLIPRLMEENDHLKDLLKEAEERWKKSETARNAAIKELNGVAAAVDDLSDFIDEQIHPLVQYDVYLALRENTDSISMWQYESEWRKKREE